MKKLLSFITVAGLIMCSIFSFVGCKEKYNYYEVPKKSYAEGEEFLQGCGNYNNGYDKESEEVDRLISVLPSEKQLDYLELEYYNFIHFGMNTMTGKEWGTGKESPSKFNPKNLDTDQSLNYMNQYLGLIGIGSWESVIGGFDASKLPASDF